MTYKITHGVQGMSPVPLENDLLNHFNSQESSPQLERWNILVLTQYGLGKILKWVFMKQRQEQNYEDMDMCMAINTRSKSIILQKHHNSKYFIW